MELTMDARLRRMWRQFAEPELRGIAAAKVGNSATVVAVVNREPGAYEGSRLRETFGDHFEDRGLRVVAAVADSYEDLVRAWFKQVDGSPGRLVGSGRSRTTRCCGLALIRRCGRPRSGLEACPLAHSPIERRYAGWSHMSASNSWRRTRRADHMSMSGPRRARSPTPIRRRRDRTWGRSDRSLPSGRKSRKIRQAATIPLVISLGAQWSFSSCIGFPK
jgi:hypothetical protein